MGTRPVDSNVGCQLYLPLPACFYPTFLHSLTLTTRIPKHNIPHPRPDPAFPSHPFIGQGARRAWMDHRGASPSAAQGLGMGNSNSNAANAQTWNWAPGWGVSACRPSGWIHWLPHSQHEKQDSPESTLLFC